MVKHGVATAGIGVVKNGRLSWTGYYGEQAPGISASRATFFNVASITKTVAAETVLRLVAAGKMSLDEAMAANWVDPDIAADPRSKLLTPRMTLDHTTGFPNWRSGRMSLSAAPGTSFGYSGEGLNYVARFVEQKLGRGFHLLVKEYVLDPAGIAGMSLSAPNATMLPMLALPTDDRDITKRLTPGCNSTGQFCVCRPDPRNICRRWHAADDMIVTVEDFATFMIDVMNGEGLTDAIRAERFNPRVFPRGDWQSVDCKTVPAPACPKAEGWGLGWEVLDYGDHKLVSHGGGDWGEVSLAAFDTRSKDGVIVFLNGRRPGANGAMAGIIRLVDPASPLAARYERWYRQ
jgi:CubicO group peptidase (beta-lactamase class C family)